MTEQPNTAKVPPRKGDGRNHEAPDTVCVRITDANGVTFRLVCRLGIFSVWKEPADKCVFRFNIGRMRAIGRAAASGRREALRCKESLTELTSVERREIFLHAMMDAELRFFESVRATVGETGGWSRLLGLAEDILDAHNANTPWQYPCRTLPGNSLL
jgi:hypothetical protein